MKEGKGKVSETVCIYSNGKKPESQIHGWRKMSAKKRRHPQEGRGAARTGGAD